MFDNSGLNVLPSETPFTHAFILFFMVFVKSEHLFVIQDLLFYRSRNKVFIRINAIKIPKRKNPAHFARFLIIYYALGIYLNKKCGIGPIFW
jgi:hypothetical protein